MNGSRWEWRRTHVKKCFSLALTALALAAGARAEAGGRDAAERDPRLNPREISWGFHTATNANPQLPRVLLIGDSIVGGYRGRVAAALAGKANVDSWLTGMHEAVPELHDYLRKALAHGPYDVIHFNIGLHGWPKGRIPEGQYEPLMRKYVGVLVSNAPKAKLIWASTTPVTTKGAPELLDPAINPTIIERNAIAARIMAEHHIAVDDLYSLMPEKLATAKSANKNDQFHWGPVGIEVQADAVAANILKNLP
jgi:hypothetical protein